MSYDSQHKPPLRVVSNFASVGERLLALWLGLTFAACVFVALPNEATAIYAPVRRAARIYLRTLGLDQYWKMFVGDDWLMPQLRIVAVSKDGAKTDITATFEKQGVLYRHLLDDHIRIAHIVLARGETPQLLASYAEALRARLGPEVTAIQFQQVFEREAPVPRRTSPGLAQSRDGAARPLATFRWE